MKHISLSIDTSRSRGKIKPMHSINNAPFRGADFSKFYYLSEAGIPYSRLHDTGGIFGSGVFVDIANIFPDFDKDPYDPSSYRFPFTDHLLRSLVDAGTEPFYRLGCTIENYSSTVAPMRIFPPKDNQKWAVICEHIIRHYNEGWSNGYHLGIKYWEIWNEPDNNPDPSRNPMWNGSMEEFFQLYEVTANHLKKCFPSLRIGGYASCGFYDILSKGSAADANVSVRTAYFVEFFEKFIEYITMPQHTSPLDFFSWHSYADRDSNIAFAEYVRKMLDKHGFTSTESILNEWNPGIELRGTTADSSKIAAMFIVMQNSPVDMLSYYDGYMDTSYGGMFNPLTRSPFKAYYSFKAFNALYRLGDQCSLQGERKDGQITDGVYALAAMNGEKTAVLLSNTSETCIVTLPDNGKHSYKLFMLDQDNDLECTDTLKPGDGFILSRRAVALLEE